MDAYFDRIKKYQLNPELPSRIRFMLQDVVELRENNVSFPFHLNSAALFPNAV